MDTIEKALHVITRSLTEQRQRVPVPFDRFLVELAQSPYTLVRNIFQVFYDMIKTFVGEGIDEYSEDPESIHYVKYDCNRLFVENSDNPFFADRLFANRLLSLVESWKRGTQQNKIYIFNGPPGCGKSTFLNNLLTKFEEFTLTAPGRRYEIVWRLEPRAFNAAGFNDSTPFIEKLTQLIHEYSPTTPRPQLDVPSQNGNQEFLEIPCPSHDNPILIIPRSYRRTFFDNLLEDGEFKFKLFHNKEYEWVFKDEPCTICSTLYQALIGKLIKPEDIYHSIFARPYEFNRRLGEGITVYNPGDSPMPNNVVVNSVLQRSITGLLGGGSEVKYLYSQYAKTNNGIYALMDIKSHNTERLIELHNIISEGVHKVEDIEENVNSLLIAVMNPEDQKNVQNFQSFSDRIEYVKIPYVMDLNTEVAIYRSVFGREIDENFLPRTLHNFARVIISSRLNTKSKAMLEWIKDPSKYAMYCDENLQLLKMEIYTGYIPEWLSEEDRKALTATRRRDIIAEGENEGDHGISGRDSIKIFNEFYSAYARTDKLITMEDVYNFFTKTHRELSKIIPHGFLDSLLRLYDYTILQEVKESIFYYNEKQIARDIMNYLFAINFEAGTHETCTYTGERLDISEELLAGIEARLLGTRIDEPARKRFRETTQREYTSRTLTQEIMVEGKDISDTAVYHSLHERYTYNIKGKALDPFLDNENFRRAIKDYGEKEFRTYEKRIKNDVRYLMKNLRKKFYYTDRGAKEICIYVIDNDIAKKFTDR